ncbi:MAG TPA: hypothetical protein VNU28_06565 [Solirubrobacteraceae bacterium]|jgi:hypothetical protein|nr:hypothetical protein [Solirubrobacteraceae bacterium]
MSLWHRAPREVYRVYGEDRYLDAETAQLEEAATVERDEGGEGSWSAPAHPGDRGVSSVRSRESHAGRLVGLGLLVGVILATLALVLLNASRRHRAVIEPAARGVGVAEQRGYPVDSASGVDRVPAIVDGGGKRPKRAPRLLGLHGVAPVRSAPRPRHGAPFAGSSDPTVRFEQAWALRSPSDRMPAPAAVEPPAEDEFGFER